MPEMRCYPGADVDRDKRMRQGVVQFAGDTQSLAGDSPPAILFALARRARLALQPGSAQCAA